MNGVRKTCDPSTGWTRIERPPAGQGGEGIEIYKGTERCLGVNWGGASPVAGFIYSGTQFTGLLGFDGKTASCDPVAGHQIELETARPECAPWNWKAAGHLVPELTCEATVPGSCDAP